MIVQVIIWLWRNILLQKSKQVNFLIENDDIFCYNSANSSNKKISIGSHLYLNVGKRSDVRIRSTVKVRNASFARVFDLTVFDLEMILELFARFISWCLSFSSFDSWLRFYKNHQSKSLIHDGTMIVLQEIYSVLVPLLDAISIYICVVIRQLKDVSVARIYFGINKSLCHKRKRKKD